MVRIHRAFSIANFGHIPQRRVVNNMAKGGGGGYKIPNGSSGTVKSPNQIIKNQKSPKKTTGGDLRSK